MSFCCSRLVTVGIIAQELIFVKLLTGANFYATLDVEAAESLLSILECEFYSKRKNTYTLIYTLKKYRVILI